MSDLHSYFTAVGGAVLKRNGAQLSSFIALPLDSAHSIKQSPHKDLSERARGINCLSYASSNLSDEGIADIVGHRLLGLVSLSSGDYKKAYEHILCSYNAVLDYLKEENSSWILPVLFRVSNDLRLVANKVISI